MRPDHEERRKKFRAEVDALHPGMTHEQKEAWAEHCALTHPGHKGPDESGPMASGSAPQPASLLPLLQPVSTSSGARGLRRLEVPLWIIVALLLGLLLFASRAKAQEPSPSAARANAAHHYAGLFVSSMVDHDILIIRVQNQGTTLATKPAGLLTFNCTTNMTCSYSANVFTLTAGAGGSVAWSGITAPTANLSLAHAAFTTTFTWNAATGAGVNLFNFADTLNNTGTGFFFDFNRASGSAIAGPLQYRDNAVAKFQVTGSGRTRAATELSVYETADVSDNTNFSMFDIFFPAAGTAFRLQAHSGGTGTIRPLAFGFDTGTFTERLRLSTSGGLSLGTGALDPGAGVFNVDTGYRIANAATLGRYLRGDGTNFVQSAIAAAGIGGCTNQFPRTLNDAAAPTCASIAKADLPATTVFTDQANTYTAGAQDLGAAASLVVPKAAGSAPTAQGDERYDTTQDTFKQGGSGAITGAVPRVLASFVCNSTVCTCVGTGCTAGTFTTNCVSGGADANCTNAGTVETNFGMNFSVPANFFIANKNLRVSVGFEATATATVPTFQVRMKVGSVVLYTALAATPPVLTAAGSGAQLLITGTAAPGVSVNLETQTTGTSSISGVFNTRNTTAQPVAAATNGALTLQASLQLGTATIGNFVRLRQMIVEELD